MGGVSEEFLKPARGFQENLLFFLNKRGLFPLCLPFLVVPGVTCTRSSPVLGSGLSTRPLSFMPVQSLIFFNKAGVRGMPELAQTHS